MTADHLVDSRWGRPLYGCPSSRAIKEGHERGADGVCALCGDGPGTPVVAETSCDCAALGLLHHRPSCDKAEPQSSNPMGRDSDWILAMGHALGLKSGYEVPIVPEVEPFKELFAEIRRRAHETSGWRPIGTAPAPKGIPALFWVVPKPADECYTDTDGNPIVSPLTGGRIQFCPFGHWSALSKATHWMPAPLPPEKANGPASDDPAGAKRQAQFESAAGSSLEKTNADLEPPCNCNAGCDEDGCCVTCGADVPEAHRPLTGVAFLQAWMRAHNPMLGGITPLDMLKMGRGEKLASFIEEAYAAEGGAERLAPAPKPYWEREPPHCSSCACESLPEQVLGAASPR